MIHLVTCANARYLGTIRPYLESLSKHWPYAIDLMCTDCWPDNAYQMALSRVAFRQTPRTPGSPDETMSCQHGGFLPYLPGSPDDVIVFTDGDITMQRNPTPDEREWLESFPKDTVAAGWNSGPDETLMIEAARLFMKKSAGDFIDGWGKLVYKPCYNIGVIVARRETWAAIHDAYMLNWERIGDYLQHPARQQWLVCYTIHSLGLDVQVTPYAFHANGHYGVPPGVHYVGEKLFAGSQMVLFRHRL